MRTLHTDIKLKFLEMFHGYKRREECKGSGFVSSHALSSIPALGTSKFNNSPSWIV